MPQSLKGTKLIVITYIMKSVITLLRRYLELGVRYCPREIFTIFLFHYSSC
jgi:hypothetical protein